MKRIIEIDEDYYEIIKHNVKNMNGSDYKPFVLIANSETYEERPKGKWIEESSETGALGIKYIWVKCNQCGWDNSLVIPKNFCPNCGADMRGKEE